MKGELTWIELSKNAFRQNFHTLRKLTGKKVLLAPCVKANGYGHGLVECSKIFVSLGADWLCVDSVDEAVLLRKNSIRCPMLIMGYVGPKDLPKAVKYDVRVFLYDLKDARALSRAGRRLKKNALVHIKIDTGMHRQGVLYFEFEKFLRETKLIPRIKIEGVATHFATADGVSREDLEFYQIQKMRFQACVAAAKKILKSKFLAHCANSGALLQDRESFFDLVRPGIAVYGYYPTRELEEVCKKSGIVLWPAMKFFTTVAQIKLLQKGDCVSYGCVFHAPKRMRIAVLPVGYYDGIKRDESGRGGVVIRGKPARIIGRICMNIMMADISHIPRARVGDPVLLLGPDSTGTVKCEAHAKILHTIPYEIITQLRESIVKHIVL